MKRRSALAPDEAPIVMITLLLVFDEDVGDSEVGCVVVVAESVILLLKAYKAKDDYSNLNQKISFTHEELEMEVAIAVVEWELFEFDLYDTKSAQNKLAELYTHAIVLVLSRETDVGAEVVILLLVMAVLPLPSL